MGRVLHVDVLSILFGLGTWLCVNGLWVELPLLVQNLPEGWNLPSYLSVIVQLSNLGPLSYTLLNSFFPYHVTEKRSTYFVMVIGLISTILLALFWDRTTIVAGDKHSTALLILVFFLASVDCSSRVLYLPFMAKFQEIYLTSYFIGEGLSGFVPSIVALGQGVGGNPECRNKTDGTIGTESIPPDPRFSIDVFFYFLFAFTLISAIAFFLLNKESVIVNARNSSSSLVSSSSGSKSVSSREGSFYTDTSIFELPTVPDHTQEINGLESIVGRNRFSSNQLSDENPTALSEMSQSVFIYLIVLLTLTCLLANGVFPSIQSYSCLPYGNLAYHLAVTLSNMANPAVCFLAFFIPAPNKKSISIVAALSLVVSGYIMATAVQSPTPPLVGKGVGEVLLVISWILLVGMFTYVKVSIATILRTKGKSGLFWCGAMTQVGSTIGAIVTFFVVNYTTTFKAYYPCS